MINAVHHRGPDATEIHSEKYVGLAHARLSIVDLSSEACQPMWDVSGRYAIIFNGEIYNFKELRTELKSNGHHFETLSDTEVILEAYKRWGLECHERFNGMWAFALWDKLECRLVLSRDRFGVKPLFVTKTGSDWLFASEVKALLAAGVDPRLNDESLRWYLVDSGCDRGEMSLFEGIHSVLPGSYIVFERRKEPKQTTWWKTHERMVSVPKTRKERSELFRNIFLDAVRIRLRNDVKTALTLSSGLDSSSVYGAYHHLLRAGQVRTATDDSPATITPYVVSYPSEPIDEAPKARALAEYYGDSVRLVFPKPEDFHRLMNEVTWHQESLVWNGSVLAFHEIYRLIAADGVRVILEGHGSDEMLAGYPHFAQIALDSYIKNFRPFASWRAAKVVSAASNPDLGQGVDSPYLNLWNTSVRILKGSSTYRSLKGALKTGSTFMQPAPGNSAFELEALGPPKATTIPPEWRHFSALKQSLFGAFHESILPNVLRVFDRATMAHGIESRAPFMDYRLVQFVFSLSDSDLIGDSFTKLILRKSMDGIVPKSTLYQKKKLGFAIDLPRWLTNESVRVVMQDGLSNGMIAATPWLNEKKFSALLEKGRRSDLSWPDATELWRAYSFAVWHQKFIQRGSR